MPRQMRAQSEEAMVRMEAKQRRLLQQQEAEKERRLREAGQLDLEERDRIVREFEEDRRRVEQGMTESRAAQVRSIASFVRGILPGFTTVTSACGLRTGAAASV